MVQHKIRRSAIGIPFLTLGWLVLSISLVRGGDVKLPKVKFAPPLPLGWEAMQGDQRDRGSDYSERVTKVRSPDGQVGIHIQFSTPSVLEKNPSTFEEAASRWKKSAQDNLIKFGMLMPEEEFKVVRRKTGMQAILSFKAVKEAKTLFIVSTFRVENGMCIKVGVTGLRDIRNDSHVSKILESIQF